MESTQRQLSTRLTDRLCSNDTDSFSLLNHTAGSKVTSVTLGTYAFLRFASQYRTDFYTFNRRIFNFLCDILSNFFTSGNNQLTGGRMNNIMYWNTSEDTFIQSGNNFIVIFQSSTNQTAQCSTVFFINNHIMRYVYKTTSQVSGIGSLQSCIRQTFTSTVGRDKVLQYRQTFLKVWKNRVFNNLSTFSTGLLRLSHQTTHTWQLTNLFLRTTSTGIKHHKYWVETLVIIFNSLIKDVRQIAVDMSPCINNLVVTFIISDETHIIVHHDLLNFFVTAFYQFFFFLRNNNITQVEWQTTLERHVVT